MCGIAGIFNLDAKPIKPELLYQMSSTLKHRGPDSQGYGFFHFPGSKFIVTDKEKPELPFPCSLGLGHLRLAILDLSARAAQPMSNEDGSLWLVFNGEIFNYLELRSELKAAGHQFRSQNDAEVILHAYEEWGKHCLNRFNGMWAFALLDRKKSTLLLSRDRFGIKPLYYLHTDNKFIFASEIKAILKISLEERKPNHNCLYHFLTTGLQDDSEQTFFQNIVQLPAASCMEISSQGTKLWQFWNIEGGGKGSVKEEHSYEEFLHLLKDSVKLRLRSDVPVGTCLSGGLDSSSIVSLATAIAQQPFHTFSAVYKDKAYDESHYMHLMVKHCHTHPHFISPKAEELFETLPTIIWHQDEPTSAPGIYSQWKVMELARGKVKVLLDGQGGDELLAGYHSFFLPYLADYVRRSINPKNWIDLVGIIGEIRCINTISPQSYAKLLLSLISPQMVHGVERFILKKQAGINPDFNNQFFAERYNPAFKSPFRSKLNGWLLRSLTQISLPALLHYEDRNSMAFSIEARTPLLDYRLAEFLFKLPFDYKIRNGTTKYILRKAMEGLIPAEILNRKDKKGFPTPVALWFRGELKEGIRGLLTSSSFRERGIFDQKKILRLFEKHCQGKGDYSWNIWRWINLELWFQRFIDGLI